jgi:hypothetical protein
MRPARRRCSHTAAYECQVVKGRRWSALEPGSSLSPLFAAQQRRESAQTNMGRVQFHAQSVGVGLARQHAIGRVQAACSTRAAFTSCTSTRASTPALVNLTSSDPLLTGPECRRCSGARLVRRGTGTMALSGA